MSICDCSLQKKRKIAGELDVIVIQEDDLNGLLTLIRKINNFFVPEPLKDFIPFYADCKLIGLVKKAFVQFLLKFPDVLEIEGVKHFDGVVEGVGRISLSNKFTTCETRTAAIRNLMHELRQHSASLVTLKGWRDEEYTVYHHFHEGPIFNMERAATCILGVRRYGVHINGFVRNSTTGAIEKMWIAQRSSTKQTHPGQLDNLAAGGVSSGFGIVDAAKKELQEEASVSEEMSGNLQPTGMLSYCYEDARGLCPENLFSFDLEVPADFTPVNSDGEVESFALKSIPEVFKLITQPNFKANSAITILDFLIRHGFITPEHTNYYGYLIASMHVDPFAHFSPLVQCPVVV